MKIKDTLYLSYKNIVNNKTRTLFTVAGITVAFSTILILISLGLGFQKIITEQVSTEDSLKILDVVVPDNGIKAIEESLISDIESITGVKNVVPSILLPATIDYGSLTEPVSLQGVSSDYFISRKDIILDSKNIELQGSKKAVLTVGALNELGISGNDAIGRELDLVVKTPKELLSGNDLGYSEKINNIKILGIYEDEAPIIYMDLEALENDLGVDKYNVLSVMLEDTEDVELIKTEIEELNLVANYKGDTIKKMDTIFFVISILLGGFGAIALIVAIIGTINTLSVSLIERTKEIGVLKSFGIKRSHIINLFLSEAVIITMLGAIGGILLSIILEIMIGRIFNFYAGENGVSNIQIFYTPYQLFLATILFSLFIGLFSGIVPAIRASKINILDAFKYE